MGTVLCTEEGKEGRKEGQKFYFSYFGTNDFTSALSQLNAQHSHNMAVMLKCLIKHYKSTVGAFWLS